jgi:hypothetical protein
MRLGRLARGGFAAVVGSLALAVVTAAPASAAPQVVLESDTVVLGETVHVRGTGWPVGDFLTVEFCGNYAVNGSADCVLESSTQAAVSRDGTFFASIPIEHPRAYCPCVIRVTAPSLPQSVKHLVQVAGIADSVDGIVRDDAPQIARSLAVTSVEVSGDGPVQAWFGAAPRRTLLLTVENRGNVTVHDPPLSVFVGKGPDPSGHVDPVSLGSIAPGESVVVEVPVELPPLAIGGYSIAGTISGFGPPVRFEARTSAYPWGLFIVACGVLVQVALVALRNRLRRRLLERHELQVRFIDREPVEVRRVDGARSVVVRREPTVDLAAFERHDIVPADGARPPDELVDADRAVVDAAESLVHAAAARTGSSSVPAARDSRGFILMAGPADDLLPSGSSSTRRNRRR